MRTIHRDWSWQDDGRVVRLHSPEEAPAWQRYVMGHADSSSYHLWPWLTLLGENLAHRAYPLSVWRADRLCGVLPLIHMRRPLMDNLLISLPFVNYGGILSDMREDAAALEKATRALASTLGVRGIELRHRKPEIVGWPARDHRVTMLLKLPPDLPSFQKKLGSKLRSQIRRAGKAGLVFQRGGEEHLDAFYRVFATNMRDLGSPVWSKGFFRRILRAFPGHTYIYRADLEDQPVAVGLIFRFKQTVEIPWASSLRAYNRLSGNVGLYGRILEDAVREGYEIFDFGRSAPDGGTFRFKAQWKAEPHGLHWHVWPGTAQAESGLEGHRSGLEALWRRLPVEATLLAGPPIRRLLPQ